MATRRYPFQDSAARPNSPVAASGQTHCTFSPATSLRHAEEHHAQLVRYVVDCSAVFRPDGERPVRTDSGGVKLSRSRTRPSLHGQTLRFEVGVREAGAPDANPSGNLLEHRELITTDPGLVRYVNVGLKGLIMNIYNLKDYQVVGPDWLKTVAVDIDATMRPGATRE